MLCNIYLFFISSLRNLHTFFHSCCTNLHSHEQYTCFSFLNIPCQHLLSIGISRIAILIVVVLICIFLTISDIYHLFMCLLSIFLSSLEKCLFKFSTHLLIGLLGFFFWYWGVWAVYIFWIFTPCGSYHLQICSSIL